MPDAAYRQPDQGTRADLPRCPVAASSSKVCFPDHVSLAAPTARTRAGRTPGAVLGVVVRALAHRSGPLVRPH